MSERVEEIELHRLDLLEEQAALRGPQTDPAILIEIAELKSKRRRTGTMERRLFVSGLDYQFLMDVVAAALVRLGQVEASLSKNDRKRVIRQIIHDVWMVVITTMMFFILWLQIINR
jgi:hypothetical protein